MQQEGEREQMEKKRGSGNAGETKILADVYMYELHYYLAAFRADIIGYQKA